VQSYAPIRPWYSRKNALAFADGLLLRPAHTDPLDVLDPASNPLCRSHRKIASFFNDEKVL
jgi:hypothetical protein